jgi:flagellar basal-body rod protein FlgF
MVSGRYSALSGAIAREQAISNISNNLANISTTGYRRSQVSFEAILRGEQQTQEAKGINYSRIRRNFSDFSPGALRKTEDPLNFAILGDGFFKIQGANGPLYTRRGDFMINATGLLTTSTNQPVLDEGNGQITIPDTDTIYLLGLQGARSEVGKMAVVNINDKQKLKRESDTTFSLESGGAEQPVENTRVIQGGLEQANVNMSLELTQMIDSFRTFETYHKVLKSYSTLGETQDELGTLA